MNQADETSTSKRKSEEVLESEQAHKKICTNANSEDMKSKSIVNNNDDAISIKNVGVDNAEENIKIKETTDQDSVDSSSQKDFNFDNQEKKQEPTFEGNVNKESLVDSNKEEKKSENLDSEEKRNENVNLESNSVLEEKKNTAIEENIDTCLVDSNDNTDNLDQATANSQLPPRQRCKYGSQCYRLNADHKAEFSHPNDADYDVTDNRPECPYGLDCYRKNPQHKLDYKHTHSRRRRSQTAARSASPQDLSDLDDSWEESVDESDYDPSFIDDDSLEEFESSSEDDGEKNLKV